MCKDGKRQSTVDIAGIRHHPSIFYWPCLALDIMSKEIESLLFSACLIAVAEIKDVLYLYCVIIRDAH